jgi:hypothetical protein
MTALYPGLATRALTGRLFALRALRHLAEVGVRQFIDLGCGIPVTDPTHRIVQDVAADTRVVDADSDPFVVLAAKVLLQSHPDQGLTHHMSAHVLEPHDLLREVAGVLDLTQPVAVLLAEVLQDVPAHFLICDAVQALMNGLPVGSYLALSHPTNASDEALAAASWWNGSDPSTRISLRSPEVIHDFFKGLELLEPGLVPYGRWRPECMPLDEATPDVDGYCGVARKVG